MPYPHRVAAIKVCLRTNNMEIVHEHLWSWQEKLKELDQDVYQWQLKLQSANQQWKHHNRLVTLNRPAHESADQKERAQWEDQKVETEREALMLRYRELPQGPLGNATFSTSQEERILEIYSAIGKSILDRQIDP